MKTPMYRIFLLLLTFFTFGCAHEKKSETYDLIIQNARVIDGTGEKAYYAHVLIKDDSIVSIEKDTSMAFSGRESIDAKGYILTPGFIDTHSHGDPLETPEFENFVTMGVTTISLGQDGRSPGEKDLKQWMGKVDSAKPAVNIAMFAGHNTIRELSGIGYDSVPQKENLAEMQQLLNKAMDDGCFGMTTGLEYSPGNFSKRDELQSLAKIVGDKNGIIMSHMRNEDDLEMEASIKELLGQGEFCPVHISHIKVVYGKGQERAQEILQLLDSARAEGIEVTADFYPYTASYTGIAILFPDWAKRPNNYQEVLKIRRDELADFLRKKVAQRNGPDATLIGTGPFKGKTLADISEELDKPFEEVLIEDIGPYGAGAAHFIMDETLQETFLTHQKINICSDGSPTMRHPRSYGSFPKIMETYVLQKDLLSLEEAIYKMSGLAAKTIQLKNRGTIKEGNKADILIFKPEEIKEKATYEDPHQLAEGIQYVIVNGKTAKDPDGFREERNGKVLKKN